MFSYVGPSLLGPKAPSLPRVNEDIDGNSNLKGKLGVILQKHAFNPDFLQNGPYHAKRLAFLAISVQI